MAAEPLTKPSWTDALRLTPFDARCAERLVSWVRDAREAYWLAPRTKPPLTVEKVLAWAGTGRDPLMLLGPDLFEPVAYGEVNLLVERQHEYWLGHLIVDPQHRGRGVGRQLTRLLLLRAFRRYAARRVSLVVFPDNVAAVASYHAAGMRADGYETHTFAHHHRRERLLRMIATSAPR